MSKFVDLNSTQELKYSIDLSLPGEGTSENENSFDLNATEELTYSIDLSSSEDKSESESSDDDSDVSIPDFSLLKPYDHEPIRKLSRSPSPSSESSSSDEEITEQTRIGNTKWCQCSNCMSMETYEESLCCRDTNDVPDDYFKGW